MIRTLKKLLSHRNPLRLAWHHAKALCAAFLYRFPARKLTIIGITGTDGKTTTVGMTAHILEQANISVAALSTSYFKIKDQVIWNETQKTAPSPFTVQKFLHDALNSGCTHVVLEYSSHGLVQGRTHYTWPSVAGITNTAQEHLDYHGTMSQYRKDKALLFRMLGGKGVKVLNADDETFETYNEIPSEKTITYSSAERGTQTTMWISDKEAETRSSKALLHYQQSCSGSTFGSEELSGSERGNSSGARTTTYNLQLNIPGTFNLENAMCAIGCADAIGVSIDDALKALLSFQTSPGRMEVIDEGQPFSVYVDFTVTPQAFQKTLGGLRSAIAPENRLLVLTGSCGDRFQEKRSMVAKICSDLADVFVVTDDETYGEDPQKIIEEVWQAVDQSAVQAHKIFDRREAIKFILSEAREGDAVILCGLGSYPLRMTPSGPVEWNEQEITRELLKSM